MTATPAASVSRPLPPPPAAELGEAKAGRLAICLASRSLSAFPPSVLSHPQLRSITRLDVSRNKIRALPDEMALISSLTSLNVSHNLLRKLPRALGELRELVSIDASGNFLKKLKVSVPAEALASLPRLRRLDLRQVATLREKEGAKLRAALPPRVEVLVTPTRAKPEGKEQEQGGSHRRERAVLHACDRDATLLESQLSPWGTHYLRSRLQELFGVVVDPSAGSATPGCQRSHRAEVMAKLLECYGKEPPRRRRWVRGVPLCARKQRELLSLLREWSAAQRAGTGLDSKERPTVRTQAYMILRSPLEFGKKDSAKALAAARKLQRHRRIWEKAHDIMRAVDPQFAGRYTAIAVTHNFLGSPHIDTQNIGPFYSVALGSFAVGTGALCVESGPREVTQVDTRGRLGKVDGRFPHWVAPDYTGDRFSLVYYVTEGKVEPRSTAVFSRFEPNTDWIDRERRLLGEEERLEEEVACTATVAEGLGSPPAAAPEI